MNEKLEDLLATHSFVQWIKGDCTAEQKAYWKSWMEDKSERRKLVSRAKEMEAALGLEYDIPDGNSELMKLNRKIDSYEKQHLDSNASSRHQWNKRQKVRVATALLLLAILIGGVEMYRYNFLNETSDSAVPMTAPVQTYNTGYGERITFRMSEGSRIVLNANSDLKLYSQAKQELDTEVWLNGEAYFDIAHLEGNQQRTFTVHTNNGSIQVLGTRFAVNTFQEETQTVLEEGKIKIQIGDEQADTSAQNFLHPGEMARFKSGDKNITVKKVNTRNYTSWTKDKFAFDQASILEVAQRIEHTFGVEVIVGNDITGESISGTIRSDNTEVLTKALSKLLSVPVKKKNNQILIGTTN